MLTLKAEEFNGLKESSSASDHGNGKLVIALKMLYAERGAMKNQKHPYGTPHQLFMYLALIRPAQMNPTLMNLAIMLTELDQLDRSRELLVEADRLFKRLGHTLHQAILKVNLADICIDLGKLDEAWEALEDGLALADPNAWLRVTAFAHALAADIWLKRRRPRRARRRINHAVSICEEINDPFVAGLCACVHGRVLGKLGDMASATERLDAARSLFETALEGVVLGRHFVRLGNAWADLGEPTRAQAFADQAQELLLGNRQETLRLTRELAELRARLQASP